MNPLRMLLLFPSLGLIMSVYACSSSREPNNKTNTNATQPVAEVPATSTERADTSTTTASLDDTLHYRQINWHDARITVRVRGSQDNQLSIKIAKPNEDLPEFTIGWNGILLGQVLVADLNQNNEPEIYIAGVDNKHYRFSEFSAYERGANNFTRFDLPELTENQNGGYRGGDLFWFDNLTVCRAIKIYRTQDLDNNPTGGERRIYYKVDNIPSLSFAGMQAMERK